MPTDPKDYVGKQIKAQPYDENKKPAPCLMVPIVDPVTHEIKGYLPAAGADAGDGTAKLKIVGAAGPTGPTGPTGPIGATGPTGATGPEFLPQVVSTLHVNKNRTDTYTEDGSIDRPFKTAQAAVNHAETLVPSYASPVAIILAPGTYTEQVTIKYQGIHLYGYGQYVTKFERAGTCLIIQDNGTDPEPWDMKVVGISFRSTTSDYSVVVQGIAGTSLAGNELQFRDSNIGGSNGIHVNLANYIDFQNTYITGAQLYEQTSGIWCEDSESSGSVTVDWNNAGSKPADTSHYGINFVRHLPRGIITLLNAGTIGEDLRPVENKASTHINDSSVTGVTVKEALEHLDSVKLEDAPSDGKTYGRKDAGWSEVTGGGGGAISTISTPVSFSAEQTKDFDVTIGANAFDLIFGRLYISANPGAGFFDNPTVYFYSHSDRKDDQILFMATVPLVFTTFASGSGPGGTNVPATDASHLVMTDLLYLFNTSSEFRRAQTIAGNTITTMSTLVNAYLAGDGISNAAEFGNQLLYDVLAAGKLYARISFTAAKTVNVKLDLTVRS